MIFLRRLTNGQSLKSNSLKPNPLKPNLKPNVLKPKLKPNSLKPKSGNSGSAGSGQGSSVHPDYPARTRFAPSPTGMLHLGSLRTALYNYLLARQTKGQFIIRLEDTDQKRLVPGAEENLYESLKWAGLQADESPIVGGPYGPYRQSDRGQIYRKYVDMLLEKGLAYKCYCPKERLLSLRESAQKLKPPTTVTYDRKCLHQDQPKSTQSSSDKVESDQVEPDQSGDLGYVVRFKAPDRYKPFTDLRHGVLDLQPQINLSDRRYDDFVILKSDGLPTYHFANVVDDHLMKITHVIRGEEWLSSTPKHVALYDAFGWTPPHFVHIPLLTSLEDRKLSKRQGDLGVSSFGERGVVPQALVNFVALFGWSPPRPEKGKKVKEVMTLAEMEHAFRLDNMTKGNAKVSDSKLWYFNKHHLSASLAEMGPELIDRAYPAFEAETNSQFSKDFFSKCVHVAAGHLEKIADLVAEHPYFFQDVDYSKVKCPNVAVLDTLRTIFELSEKEKAIVPIPEIEKALPETPMSLIMQSLRFALTGMVPGVNVMAVSSVIGYEKYRYRLQEAIRFLS